MLYRIPIVGKHKGKFVLVSEEDYRTFCHLPLYINSSGYVVYIAADGVSKVAMHRTIMQTKEPRENEAAATEVYCDHIDRNKLNNTRENLRWATPYENSLNRSKQAKAATSRYKGVCWHKGIGKWQVRLTLEKGKPTKNLGYYTDEVYAAKVYNFHVYKYFHDKALTNEINE